MATTTDRPANDRDIAIAKIRAALKERSGRAWSVRGGAAKASDWGWVTITAPPARLVDGCLLTDTDRAELVKLLGLRGLAGQGVDIAPAAREQYVARAEGRETGASA